MKNYGKVYSTTRPQEITMTNTSVFIASNITPYTKEIEEHIQSGFEYDYVEYTKDEYLLQQSAQLSSLTEELAATKILLGVD